MREYQDGDQTFTVDEETLNAVREMLNHRAFLEAARYLHERGYTMPAIQTITTNVYDVSRNCAFFLARWLPEKSDAEQQDVNDGFLFSPKGTVTCESISIICRGLEG